MAEFAKRFDFDYDLVSVWSEEFLDRSWRSEDARKVHQRLRTLLQENDYACILITCYGNFPPSVWEAIYRQVVEKKAGLILFNTGGPYASMPGQMEADGFLKKEFYLSRSPLTGVSWTGCYDEQIQVDSGGNFSGFQVKDYPLAGKVRFAQRPDGSRLVLFDWQKQPYAYWAIHHAITPAGLFFPFGRIFPMADHLFALVAKAVAWASRSQPELEIVSVSPTDREVLPAQLPSLIYEVTVKNKSGRKQVAVLDWQVLDEAGACRNSGQVRFTLNGLSEKTVRLKKLPESGQHLYFRCRLLEKGKVVDFASGHVKVVYPEGLFSFSVVNGTLNPAGQPFFSHLSFPQVASADRVRVNVYDSWGRLVTALEQEVSGTSLKIPVETYGLSGYAFRIQVLALKNGAVQGVKEHFCTLLKPLARHYQNIRSDSATGTVSGWYLSQLNRLYGMSFYRTRGSPLSANMMFGYRFGVYSYYGRIAGPVPPDMSETYRRFVEEDVLPIKPYGGYLYDFGDDTGLSAGVFRSRARTEQERKAEEETDWQNFVSYLKTVYRDVHQLTDNWQVPLSDFSGVKREHISEEQKKKNLVPLLDYRQYQEWLYANHLRKMRSLLQEKIPWAKVTLNGYGDLGKNFEVVCQEVDSLVPYYRPSELRVLRGILGRDKYLGTCTGAYYSDTTDKRFLAFIPWETVLLGGNTIFLWGAGCITGDGGLSEATYPIFESCRELSRGPGELLACSEWENDGVYILHSPASNHAQETEPRLGMTRNSSESFATLLEELQVNYDFISSGQVAAGELVRRRARVLFLPYSVGLEPAAQKAVRDFVSSGGTVVADFRPATRTVHGKLLDGGQLDDLFGVKQRKVSDLIVRGQLSPAGIETLADASTEPVTARVGGRVGQAPVVLTGTAGQGKTVLLNFFVGKYRSLYAAGLAGPFTEWLAGVLKEAGLAVRPYGVLPSGTRVFRFRRPEMEILAIYREDVPGTPEKVTLSLPLAGKKAIYRLRSGGFFGQDSQVSVTVGKLEPCLLALLESPLPRLEVKAAGLVAPGQPLKISVAAGQTSVRLLRLDIFQPDGRSHPESGGLFWLTGGKTELVWKPALSDPPGSYRLEVADVVSGEKKPIRVTVKGQPVITRR